MNSQQRLIFWLLVAATIAVDAVAISWARAPFQQQGLAVVALEALIISQLSIVCIWSALTADRAHWAIAAPLLAIAATGLAAWHGRAEWVEWLPYYGLHAALLWALLKGLERTPFWRRHGGRPATWRYSMAQLLIAMTIVAVLLPLVRQSEILADADWQINLALITGTLVLTLAAVAIWSLSIHWLQRLAATLGCAIAISAGFALTDEPVYLPLILGVEYLIQAIVLSAWLGLGPVIPRTARSDDGRPPKPTAPRAPA